MPPRRVRVSHYFGLTPHGVAAVVRAVRLSALIRIPSSRELEFFFISWRAAALIVAEASRRAADSSVWPFEPPVGQPRR